MGQSSKAAQGTARPQPITLSRYKMPQYAQLLREHGIHCLEYGITAFEDYVRRTPAVRAPLRFVAVQTDLVGLAQVFADLRYPKLPYADAQLDISSAESLRYICVDSLDDVMRQQGVAGFCRDPVRGVFCDAQDLYPLLRQGNYPKVDSRRPNALFEAAVLAARIGDPLQPYVYAPDALDIADALDAAGIVDALDAAGMADALDLPDEAPPEYQKDLLTLILTGPHPEKAFALLYSTGFIKKYWPELAALKSVDHAKDHHPEGGGWAHTMETFSHRKTFDLTLSLALLLHDTGKAQSVSAEGRRFDKHAEIGASLAGRFLSRAGFESSLIRDVQYMIKGHMMPAALPRLPLFKVGEIVADPRFPQLLELYRCDEFSTFRGPEAYYASCAAYKAFLRHQKNPYRDNEGRKVDPRPAALRPSRA